jgi:hypothetical protein
MTGTGKTGLGIVALEEALLQGVPCIILDPKGDITNLALNFPELDGPSFTRWIDADEAARQGTSVDALASKTAQNWRDGLAQWGISPERLVALRDRVVFDVYTPGSDAGIPVNILQSLNPPRDASWRKNAEALRERIAQTVSALLALAGIDSDPVKSREHILLATIFESAWRAGQPLSIESLIYMIQQPPVQRVGAFEMDVFYPRDDRFDLAMAINNLAASPSFASWTQGRPLDIEVLVRPDRTRGGVNPLGRTRASIFYLAHLDDAERQFFVTLLLSQLVLWMRGQSGTTQLRCLVYFDETYGYCPPFPRNPPTKQPLMSIVKQGRAAGLGLFLATQNPADLDYKSLSNIGTWFIGRLRTGRDRDRALEGLEGAGAGFDRDRFESALSMLPPRVFLVQSASGEPRFMMTRWAMSYLRGPLTREQLRDLPGVAEKQHEEPPVAAPRAEAAQVEAPQHTAGTAAPVVARARERTAMAQNMLRPTLPAELREVFVHETAMDATAAQYTPHALATATVRFADRSSGVVHEDRFAFLTPIDAQSAGMAFAPAQALNGALPAQETAPRPGIGFARLPPGLTLRWVKQVERALAEHLYRHGARTVFVNRALKLYGRPDESSLAFRQRCEDEARDRRNAEATKVRATYERRMSALEDKLAREHRELSQDRAELTALKREELLAGAEAVFNFVIGRRTPYAVAFGAQRRRRTQSAVEDVRETERAIAKFNSDMRALADEYKAALNDISDKWMRVLSAVDEMPLTPKKSDIFVDPLTIAWIARLPPT